MQYQALAVDYDGTLATDGVVDDTTIDALQRLRESGRRLILVTGRIVEQLVEVFPQLSFAIWSSPTTARCSTNRKTARSTCSPSRRPANSSTSSPAAACRQSKSATSSWPPGNHTKTPCSNDSRPRARAADHFQQRRRDDPADRRQQSHRPCRRAAEARASRITTPWASATPKMTRHS